MDLHDFQNKFSHFLYAKNTDELDLESISRLIVFDRHKSNDRVMIYRNNLVFGLLECLKKTFPNTVTALGEENFSYFVRELIYSCASTHWDIRKYGKELTPFLQNQSLLAEVPWIFEIAEFEWKLHELSFCDDEPRLSTTELEKIKNESASQHEFMLTVIPMGFHRFEWNTLSIIKGLAEDPDRSKVTPLRGITHVVSFINDGRQVSQEISEEIFCLLQKIYMNSATVKSLADESRNPSLIGELWDMLHFCCDNGWLQSTK